MAGNSDLKLSFAIDQAKLNQAQKGVSGLQKTTRDLEKQLQSIAKTAGTTGVAIGNGLKRFSAAQVEARNELLKGTRALKEQETALDRYRAKLAETQNVAQRGGAGGSTAPALAAAVGGSLNAAGLGELGGFSTGAGQVINAFRQLQQLAGPAAQGTTAVASSFSSIAIAGPLVAAAVIALGVAIKRFMDQIEDGKKRISSAFEAQRTYYELIQTGTTESIRAGLADLQVKRAISAQIRADAQAQIDAQKRQFGIFGGLVASTTGLTEQLKQANDEVTNLDDQINAYTRALSSNEVKARDAAEAQKKLTESYDAAIQQAAQQEAEILQRAADRRVEIARRGVEQEKDALTRLQRDLAEGRLRIDQQQADTRLQYQRDEAQSARQHLNSLLKIRKDAQANEFELVRNRDFAGLAKLRRDTDTRLAEEDDRYLEERKQRLSAIKQRLQDNQTAFIRERELRVRQYQQQLTDLRQQQVREIQANNQAAQIDLQRLRDRLVAELKLQQDGNAAALRMEANFQQQRLALMAQAIAATKTTTPTTAGVGGGGAGGGSLKMLAGGGSLGAFQTALVNEGFPGQREGFISGGKSTMLPGGMGLFTPLRSGRVESGGKGGISITIPVGSISGSTLAEARKMALSLVDQKLTEAFEALTA